MKQVRDKLGVRVWGLAFAGLLTLGCSASSGDRAHAATPKAFPTAEGFGADALGGRGGDVYHVTTLADSGSGSLRACIEASGPRTCVFRVGGTITVDSKFDVNNGRLTIAGQTAPGGGIQLRLSDRSKYRIMNINASDVIVRHVRFRRGATALSAYSSGTCCGDTVQISGQRVILDHVTLSFATDENLELYQANDVTVQNSIISYGLRYSTDADTVSNPGQHHSMGAVVASGNGNISFRHNLFAFNLNRNPRLQSGLTDICGNVVYGTTANPITLSSSARANVVGNVFNRRPQNDFDYVIKGAGAHASNNEASVPIYQSGSSAVGSPHAGTSCSYNPDAERVLAKVGPSPRDSLDAATVAHVRSGTGQLIDKPDEVGGWPTIAGGTPYIDADKDGMDDNWEAGKGLSAGNPNDRNDDRDGDGYTNLEEFLNELAGGTATASGNPTSGSDDAEVVEVEPPLEESPDEQEVSEDTNPPASEDTSPPVSETPPEQEVANQEPEERRYQRWWYRWRR